MGKEAKIGLGIILVLLIVLGVVLARRLSGPTDDATAAEVQMKSEAGKADATAGGADKPAERKSPARPTIVEARGGSATASMPPSPKYGGRWNVISESSSSQKEKAAAVAKAAPPTFMPNAPERSSALYDTYRPAQVSPRTAGAPSGGEAAASDAAGSVMVEGPAAAAPSPPAAGASHNGGVDYRYRSVPHYTPTGQLIQPTRQMEPDASNADVANPLRGPAGAAMAGDRTAASGSLPGRYTSGGYAGAYTSAAPSPSRYTASSGYRYTQSNAAASPGYSGTTAGGYRAESSPRQIAQAGGTSPAATMVGQYSQSIRPEPGRRADGTYVVQPNDNYWVISERLYGTGHYFKALAEHNREKHPQADKLDVGDVILAPTREELEQTYADLCPTRSHAEAAQRHAMAVSTPAGYQGGRVYEVQQGDTLYDIAKWELGKTSRWTEIFDLNRDVLGDDHDHLTPGLKLRLPGDAPADVVTQRPGATYQR